MKIINRFILSYFLRILGLCCAAFIGIYLLVDFFERVDKFMDYGAGWQEYSSYLVHSVPFIFVQILPLAILTSMVLTLGGLGRTNEMTALRACGISLWRVTQPLIALILLLCCLLLLLNEYLIPWSTRQLNELVEVKLKGKEQIRLTHDKIWYRSGNRIINISVAQARDKQLQGVTVFTFDDQARIMRRLDVPAAHFRDRQWSAPTMVVRDFDPDSGNLVTTQQLEQQVLDLDRQIDDFAEVENASNQLNARQLGRMITRLEEEGYDATRQRVDFHTRLAAPFTGLVMGLLGIPFALQRGRESHLALGVGLSLAVGAAYFLLQSMVISFGYAGAVSPIFAAWTGNVVFLLIAAWLFLGVKQ
ncbi:MAG: LPS export ABC transporter permease LptG [Pelovirga sp.]